MNSKLESGINTARTLVEGIEKVIRGRRDTIKLVITALLADGHALLEDYPGSGKTTLAKTLGLLIGTDETNETKSKVLPFRRIQFTPDLLPGDVLGVNIFDVKQGEFRFIHGPVFAHIVLADEINRTGPKVQAAFLECMAEKQVTIDNKTHPLHPLFFVIGTQNPLDFAGTYQLPLVQLDRFLLKIPMSYVDSATELEILEQHDAISIQSKIIEPVVSVDDIMLAREASKEIHLSKNIQIAIVEILQTTRNNPSIEFGASTRAGIMLLNALRSYALVEGRDYVTEEDLVTLLPYVLLHRLRFRNNSVKSSQQLKELTTPAVEKLVSKGLSKI